MMKEFELFWNTNSWINGCGQCTAKIILHPRRHHYYRLHQPVYIRGFVDKSLTRPKRKQATVNKLVIYSTHSPQSSTHFLARCSNIWKPLKKIRTLSVQSGLRGRNDFGVGRKLANFQLFFYSREQVVVRRGQIRRIGWVLKTLEA
jgi:hypothetical protein